MNRAARKEVGAVIAIDDIRPEYYADYIKNWARVWQMVDTDKAPLVLLGSISTVIFPPLPYGAKGMIVREENDYVFISDDGKRYACVALEIPYQEAIQLKRIVTSRIRNIFKDTDARKYNGRLKRLAQKKVS